jgi:hypothetical protein
MIFIPTGDEFLFKLRDIVTVVTVAENEVGRQLSLEER